VTVHVFTARLGIRDDDHLDVSLQGNVRRANKGEVGGHRGIGLFFAPSPELLYPYLSKRKFNRLTDGDWERYVAAYTEEMRLSYRERRPAWDALLGLPRVVLLCFCTDPERCHRTVLGRDILPKLGVTYCGEIVCAAAILEPA